MLEMFDMIKDWIYYTKLYNNTALLSVSIFFNQQVSIKDNVLFPGLGRITENTPKHQGVVVLTMSDIPIGFGVASRTTAECRHADPLATIVFHQADVGEYIRSEDTLT